MKFSPIPRFQSFLSSESRPTGRPLVVIWSDCPAPVLDPQTRASGMLRSFAILDIGPFHCKNRQFPAPVASAKVPRERME